MKGALLADRSEEKTAETAESARTHHEETCSLTCVYEVPGGGPSWVTPVKVTPGAMSAT